MGSFVGIGGGVFTIPIITSSYLRLTQRQANASNLVAVAATGFAGAAAYALADVSDNNQDDKLTQNNVQIDMAMAAAVCSDALSQGFKGKGQAPCPSTRYQVKGRG